MCFRRWSGRAECRQVGAQPPRRAIEERRRDQPGGEPVASDRCSIARLLSTDRSHKYLRVIVGQKRYLLNYEDYKVAYLKSCVPKVLWW